MPVDQTTRPAGTDKAGRSMETFMDENLISWTHWFHLVPSLCSTYPIA